MQLLFTGGFRGGERGERLLPGCSVGARLPICRRAGSRGVGSGCGGGSLGAFLATGAGEEIEGCQVILITLNVSGWRGGGGAPHALAQAVVIVRQMHFHLCKEIRAVIY